MDLNDIKLKDELYEYVNQVSNASELSFEETLEVLIAYCREKGIEDVAIKDGESYYVCCKVEED